MRSPAINAEMLCTVISSATHGSLPALVLLFRDARSRIDQPGRSRSRTKSWTLSWYTPLSASACDLSCPVLTWSLLPGRDSQGSDGGEVHSETTYKHPHPCPMCARNAAASIRFRGVARSLPAFVAAHLLCAVRFCDIGYPAGSIYDHIARGKHPESFLPGH